MFCGNVILNSLKLSACKDAGRNTEHKEELLNETVIIPVFDYHSVNLP